jgi:hypothetical protein
MLNERLDDPDFVQPQTYVRLAIMNATNSPRRAIPEAGLVLLTLGLAYPMSGEANNTQTATPPGVEMVTLVHTVPVPQVITNHIEVYVPTNTFISVYRTNYYPAFRTNVVEVHQTNWLTRTLTNTVVRDLTQTNRVTRYQTNLQTLTLTNWEPVLVFKTNWVTQPVANVVQVDVPVRKPETVAPVTAAQTVVPVAVAGGFTLEASRTGKAPVNDQVEVSMRLKAAGGPTPAISSQEWQVQRTDGSVLLFGQGPEFKRDLPLGSYKVEVKARTGANAPLRIRGNFELTRDEIIQQKPPGLADAR